MTLCVISLLWSFNFFLISPSRCIPTSDNSGTDRSGIHRATHCASDAGAMVDNCFTSIKGFAWSGYPWTGTPLNRTSGGYGSNTETSLGDPLDALDNMCNLLDRSETCLRDHNIEDPCLMQSALDALVLRTTFRYVCREQKRDSQLIHALSCVSDHRLLTMLQFHILDQCPHGDDIVEELTAYTRNAWLYVINVDPMQYTPGLLHLYCLPQDHIRGCVETVVARQCGESAAAIVGGFIHFLQTEYGNVLEGAGLTANICHSEPGTYTQPRDEDNQPVPLGASYTREGDAEVTPNVFSRFLNDAASGTALDSVWGRHLQSSVAGRTGDQMCQLYNISQAYDACVLLSDVLGDASCFNLLQYAHQLISMLYHGTGCTNMAVFQHCWRLLRELCGPATRGLVQHATLLIQGCHIQARLREIQCHWEDMLLQSYLKAARLTLWPADIQPPDNPMYLDSKKCLGRHLLSDMDRVFDLLQPGLDDIKTRCGEAAALDMQALFHNLTYSQGDAMVFLNEWYGYDRRLCKEEVNITIGIKALSMSGVIGETVMNVITGLILGLFLIIIKFLG